MRPFLATLTLLTTLVSCGPSPIYEHQVVEPAKVMTPRPPAKPEPGPDDKMAKARWHLDYVKGLIDKKIDEPK